MLTFQAQAQPRTRTDAQTAHSSRIRLSRFAALHGEEYRRFWLAALTNDVGGWLLFAAQGWLLLRLGGHAELGALFLALRLAPKVLLGIPAGALSDRIGALRVLRAARFAGVIPAMVVALAASTEHLTLNVVLISAALAAAVQAFDQPAHRSLVHTYAPGPLLVGGVALSAMAATIAGLIGPLLIALLIAGPGLLWAFPAQAVLAIASGVVLLRNRGGLAPAPRVKATVGGDCWMALRYLASTPALLLLMLLAGSPGMLDRVLTMAMPGFARGHGGAVGMVLVFLAPAAGALLGGSLLTLFGSGLQRLLPLALGSSSVAMVSVGLLATTRLFLLSLVLFLLLGAAKAAFSVTMMAALQRRVPEHARARMLAL